VRPRMPDMNRHDDRTGALHPARKRPVKEALVKLNGLTRGLRPGAPFLRLVRGGGR